MKSSFYRNGHHVYVADAIRDHINSLDHFLSEQTTISPRAVGDEIESLVSEKLKELLGEWCLEYKSDFSRRAMADIAFTDVDGVYSMIDVKTHREDTRFNRPNLTSVQRLVRFYGSDEHVFSILMIQYGIQGIDLTVSEVLFSPIEHLDWKCLSIGALGWGQIQIIDSNNVILDEKKDEKTMDDRVV